MMKKPMPEARRTARFLVSFTSVVCLAGAQIAFARDALAQARSESVREALCRLIDESARANDLPASFLTRLIWRESSIRAHVVSRAGAQGVAQFMPGTAAERGLLDPFDPEQAIPEAARFIAELRKRFGNLGLAAAAYNGGPHRVSQWLRDAGPLFSETRAYVAFITSASVEDWAQAKTDGAPQPAIAAGACAQTVASLMIPGRDLSTVTAGPFAPWGVQLAGNFSRARALASFERARKKYESILEATQPMVIGTRLRHRGARPFYRVRVPAQSRAQANALCRRIRSAGGACIVMPT